MYVGLLYSIFRTYADPILSYSRVGIEITTDTPTAAQSSKIWLSYVLIYYMNKFLRRWSILVVDKKIASILKQ